MSYVIPIGGWVNLSGWGGGGGAGGGNSGGVVKKRASPDFRSPEMASLNTHVKHNQGEGF